MALFDDLKKKLSKDVKKGGSLLYKPIKGQLDIVKDILDGPAAPIADPVSNAFRFQFNTARNLTEEPIRRGLSLQRDAITQGLPQVAPILDKTDDILTGLASLNLSDYEDQITRREDGGFDTKLTSKWNWKNLIEPESYTGERGRRNLDLLETDIGRTFRRDKNPFKTIGTAFELADEAGKMFDESDLPQGLKMAGWILGDPTTYVPTGALGKGAKALKLNESAKLSKFAPVAKPLAFLAEGFDNPKQLLGFTAGSSAAAELASHTETPWDDLVLPFVGGAVGTVKFKDFVTKAQELGMVTKTGRSRKPLESYGIIPHSVDALRNRASKLTTDEVIDKGSHFEIEIGDGYTYRSNANEAGDAIIEYKNYLERGGLMSTMRDERLFFHTTPMGTFDLLDADQLTVRHGQTQGSGIYFTSDPAHSADWYGRGPVPKTFAVEILPEAQIMNLGFKPNERDKKGWVSVIKDLFPERPKVDPNSPFKYEDLKNNPDLIPEDIFPTEEPSWTAAHTSNEPHYKNDDFDYSIEFSNDFNDSIADGAFTGISNNEFLDQPLNQFNILREYESDITYKNVINEIIPTIRSFGDGHIKLTIDPSEEIIIADFNGITINITTNRERVSQQEVWDPYRQVKKFSGDGPLHISATTPNDYKYDYGGLENIDSILRKVIDDISVVSADSLVNDLLDSGLSNFKIRDEIVRILETNPNFNFNYKKFKKNFEDAGGNRLNTDEKIKSAINDIFSRSGIDGISFASSADKDTLVIFNTEKLSTVAEFKNTNLKEIPKDSKGNFKDLVKRVLTGKEKLNLDEAYIGELKDSHGNLYDLEDIIIKYREVPETQRENIGGTYVLGNINLDENTRGPGVSLWFYRGENGYLNIRYDVENGPNDVFNLKINNKNTPSDLAYSINRTIFDKIGESVKFKGKIKTYGINPKNNLLGAVEERGDNGDIWGTMPSLPTYEEYLSLPEPTEEYLAAIESSGLTGLLSDQIFIERYRNKELRGNQIIFDINARIGSWGRELVLNKARNLNYDLTKYDRADPRLGTKKMGEDNLLELGEHKPFRLTDYTIEKLIDGIGFIDSKISNLEKGIGWYRAKNKLDAELRVEYYKNLHELRDYIDYIRGSKLINEGKDPLSFSVFQKKRQEYMDLDLNEMIAPFFSLKRDLILTALGAGYGYVSSGGDLDATAEGAGLGFMAGGLVKKTPKAAMRKSIDIYRPGPEDEIIFADPVNGGVRVPDGPIQAETLNDPNYLRFRRADNNGYNILTDAVNLLEETRAVVTYGAKDIRRMFKFIAPDIVLNTPVGRLIAGHRRMMLRSRNIVDVTISGIFDQHAGKWGVGDITGKNGTVFKTDDNGIIEDFGVHWSTVIAKYPEYEGRLNGIQKHVVESFISLLDDVKQMRIANGIDERTFTDRNGDIWIPRAVRSVQDVDIPGRTDYGKLRLYDLIEEGIEKGVNYNDIRETMRLYLVETYDDVANKQLADALESYSVSIDSLIPDDLKNSFDVAKEDVEVSKTNLSEARKNHQRAGTSETLDIFDDVLKRHDDVMLHFDAVKEKIKAYKESIRSGESGVVDGVRLREWTHKHLTGGRMFEDSDYKILVEHLGLRGVKPKHAEDSLVSSLFRKQGNVTRWLAASFDFAFPLTHAGPLLFTNPGVWLNASARHYVGVFNPKVRDDYIANNLTTIQEMSKWGVDPADPETFAAVMHGGEVPAGLLKLTGGRGKKKVNSAIKQSFGRFNSGLNTGLMVARTELWQSMSPHWEDKRALASYINKLTGGVDSQMLGASKTQRDWESTWVAFSPRLTRSILSLAGTALNPDMTDKQANQARLSLLKIAAGSIAFFTAIQMARNPEDFEENPWEAFKKHVGPSLNPGGGKKFLAVEVEGQWIGFGGQLRALTQLVYGIGVSPDKLISADSYDNPLIRYYRGRGAPAIDTTSTVAEGILGINAHPYAEINGPVDIASEIARSNLPMALQGYLEGETAAGSIASVFGPRVTRETTRESLDKKAKEIYGKPLGELNKEQKAQFYESYPPKLRKDDNVTKFFNAVDAENQAWLTEVTAKSALVKSGAMTKMQFREWYNGRTAERINKIDGIRNAYKAQPAQVPNFKGSVVDYLESKYVAPEDKAVSDWYALSEKFVDEKTGEFDFEGFTKAREKFLKDLDQGTRAYVIRNTVKEQPTDVAQQMKDVQFASQEYFQVNNNMWVSLREAKAHPIFGMFENYDQYSNFVDQFAAENSMTRSLALNFLQKRIPALKKFNEYSNEYQRLMRLADSELNEGLADWYGIEPANRIDYAAQGKGIEGYGAATAEAYAANPDLNNVDSAQRFSFAYADRPNVERRFVKEQSPSYQRKLRLQR